MGDSEPITQIKKQKTSDDDTKEELVLEDNVNINENSQENDKKPAKYKKQKVLLLFGYLGVNYQGLQRFVY